MGVPFVTSSLPCCFTPLAKLVAEIVESFFPTDTVSGHIELGRAGAVEGIEFEGDDGQFRGRRV